MFDIYLSHILSFFAGVGVCAVLGAIVLAHRDISRLTDRPAVQVTPEPMTFTRNIVVDTSLDAALDGLELPQEPHVEREWTPWDTGWAGEQTGAYAAVEVPAPQVAVEESAGLSNARDRFRYPKLNGRLTKQTEGKKTLVALTADGRSVPVRELILHGQEMAA